MNSLGYDWKQFQGSYVIVPNRAYFIKITTKKNMETSFYPHLMEVQQEILSLIQN